MKSAGMLVMVVGVIGGVAGLGALAGLGAASILAALTALFCLIASMGGPLRSDLRLFAGFAPMLVFGVAAPRLLGAVSHWGAIALLVVIMFGASLLPALGPRYVTVGLGLGMASVFGYGFQLTGTASAGQIIGAPALAVGVIFVLRLLMGLGDPGKPTRAAIADVLVDTGTGVPERAARLWLADRPARWTAIALVGATRYRAVAAFLTDRKRTLEAADAEALTLTLDAASATAAELAEAIRTKSASDDLPEVHRLEGPEVPFVDGLWSSLSAVRDATADRDQSTVDIPPKLRRDALRHELEGALSWHSAQLRHAVRCALGMAVALVVTALRPADPLTVSFLISTFAIMQPEWRDSLTKAWQRVGGSFAGGAVLALVIWLLPQSLLLPIGLVALLAGFSFIRTKPIVFNGCMVLLSVGMNANKQHLEPSRVLVEYLLLMLLAAAIGLLFGFAAVPGVRKPPLPVRFAEATTAVRDLLTTVASVLRGETTDRRVLGAQFRKAARTHQDLVHPEPGSAAPAAAQLEAVEEATEGLRGLTVTAAAMLLRPSGHPEILAANAEAAARALTSGTEPEQITAGNLGTEVELVLDTMAADVLRLRQAGAVLN